MTRSIWGTPNLPSNLVDTLTKAMAKAMKDPAFIKVVQEELLYTVRLVQIRV
jgi:tripartite-type tricarboxylate transporter receptor subunit TctC